MLFKFWSRPWSHILPPTCNFVIFMSPPRTLTDNAVFCFVFLFDLVCCESFCPSYFLFRCPTSQIWTELQMFHGTVVTEGRNRRFEHIDRGPQWAANPPARLMKRSHLGSPSGSSGLHFNSDTEPYLTCPGLSLSHDPSVCSRDQHFHLRLWHRISLFILTLMDMLEQSLDNAR